MRNSEILVGDLICSNKIIKFKFLFNNNSNNNIINLLINSMTAININIIKINKIKINNYHMICHKINFNKVHNFREKKNDFDI